MFKHRGHFLNAALSGSGETRTFFEVFEEWNTMLMDLTEGELTIIDNPSAEVIAAVEMAFSDRECSRTRKAERIQEILQISSKDKLRVTYIVVPHFK